MEWRRLNLEAIGAELHRLPEAEAAAGEDEPPGVAVIRRLALGYAYVDELLAARIDLFAYGAARHMLELNHRVLCGVSPDRRVEFRDHIEATERWFYDTPDGGVAGLSDWLRRQGGRPAIPLAAGLVFQAVSAPQLFIEGNRRTAALLASYVLARGGEPPLVAGPAHFADYDALSAEAAAIDRTGFVDMFAGWRIVRRLTAFLREESDPRFLVPQGAPRASGTTPFAGGAPGSPG